MRTKGTRAYTMSYFDNTLLATLIAWANEDFVIYKAKEEIYDYVIKNAKGNSKTIVTFNIDSSLARLEGSNKIFKKWINLPKDLEVPKCGRDFYYAINKNCIESIITEFDKFYFTPPLSKTALLQNLRERI